MLFRRPWMFAVIACMMCGFAGQAFSQSAESELPRVRVVSVSRVFHNGEHNAFTDLVPFSENVCT